MILLISKCSNNNNATLKGKQMNITKRAPENAYTLQNRRVIDYSKMQHRPIHTPGNGIQATILQQIVTDYHDSPAISNPTRHY